MDTNTEPDFEQPPPEKETKEASVTNPMNIGFGLVAAFALGLALGFFGRPQIIDDIPIQVVVTVVPDSSDTVAQTASSSAESGSSASSQSSQHSTVAQNEPTTTAQESTTSAAQPTPTIMEFVMSDARHIEGDADAPITIVEFSDFK